MDLLAIRSNMLGMRPICPRDFGAGRKNEQMTSVLTYARITLK